MGGKKQKAPIFCKISIAECKSGEKFKIYFRNKSTHLTVIDPKARIVRLFGQVFSDFPDIYLGESIGLKDRKEKEQSLPVIKITKASYQGFNKNWFKKMKQNFKRG